MAEMLNWKDYEIEPEPRFETPYQLLMHYAPGQDWSMMNDVNLTWEQAREMPGMMDLITNILMTRSHPTIRLRTKKA